MIIYILLTYILIRMNEPWWVIAIAASGLAIRMVQSIIDHITVYEYPIDDMEDDD